VLSINYEAPQCLIFSSHLLLEDTWPRQIKAF